jgi:FkbH-like protein
MLPRPELKCLREQTDEYLRRGSWPRAQAAVQQLWRNYPTAGSAAYVAACYEQLKPHIRLVPCRLAILRSFTIEPIVPILRAAGLVNGIDLTVQVGAFNTYAQDIFQSGSWLYSFYPDIAILAVQTRDVEPELWESYAELSHADAQDAARRAIHNFRTLIQSFRANSQADLIVHGLEGPLYPSQGVLDGQVENSQAGAIQQINSAVRKSAVESAGVHYLDYQALIGRHGNLLWHDERKWLTMRMPFSAPNLSHLANEWLRYIHPLTGKVCKVLVTDLDNTLWGGVVGEDGQHGIKLGRENPGAAYLGLQRAIRDLRSRGIVLAVCSKNNRAEAMRVLEGHPAMLLRPEDFSVLRINWADKTSNLREIANELNVGTDALAFLDDNPVERERVRLEMPEVTVIELPDDPFGYARTVRENPVFERLTLSNEDRVRSRLYAAQRKRLELAESAGSLENFYRSLQQEVEIARVNQETSARVAQLTQKTNQFNLTTRRYSEQQILDLAASPGWTVYSVRVKDRFGDNGIVGVLIVHVHDQICEIETFLLSCRVISRTVETSALSFLAAESRSQGVRVLQGRFIATEKNEPAATFYSSHNFRPVELQNGSTLWSMSLAEASVTCPEWIQLKHCEESRLSEYATI